MSASRRSNWNFIQPFFYYIICQNCGEVKKCHGSGHVDGSIKRCAMCKKYGIATSDLPEGYESQSEAYDYDGNATVYRIQNT